MVIVYIYYDSCSGHGIFLASDILSPMETLDVELTALVYGGDAIGRLPDGRAVFVPYALPGELVRIRLVEEKRGHARAELVEVLRPSPDRITPRCIHFGVCGGCHYQHLDYARQVEVKTAIFREQLERMGGILNPPMHPLVPSPDPWNYRNTVQFHLTSAGQVGYQRAASHAVIAIQECHLPQPALNLVWPQLAFEPGSGIERVELRLGAEDDLLIALESPSEPPELEVELSASVVYLGPNGAMVMAGDDYFLIEVLGRPFRVSAGSFFQVNTAQAAAMVHHLLALLPLQPGCTVLDVYSGVGLFSAFLAPRVGRLLAIELSPEACTDFAANLDEFDNVELYEGPAEVILPALTLRPDIVIVDPPRSGLERAALEAILHLAPPALAYVSCDPATLARDARRLIQAGYTLSQVTPFDLFPQTYAIESISLFIK
jgi:23S rRNA (uracil1939-C5)-methyltransferase